jgi:hypothetical protein
MVQVARRPSGCTVNSISSLGRVSAAMWHALSHAMWLEATALFAAAPWLRPARSCAQVAILDRQ